MDQMYLCDSGGQYLDGTTDVTRTVHFGNPTKEEKECFTRVLNGHIALGRVVFPTGTTGFMLDCLARSSLWEAGLDYRHGTGHGVGHFLNVHEGPQGISFHVRSNEVQLKPGMTVTNEPGFYLDGHFGIRIENVLVVKEAETRHNFGGTKFLKFDNLTMVPIATNLIDVTIMTDRDVKWVNDHHQECWKLVSPLLSDDKLALEWLRRATSPIRK
jgi:Xaa-Pro aminopeptidase